MPRPPRQPIRIFLQRLVLYTGLILWSISVLYPVGAGYSTGSFAAPGGITIGLVDHRLVVDTDYLAWFSVDYWSTHSPLPAIDLPHSRAAAGLFPWEGVYHVQTNPEWLLYREGQRCLTIVAPIWLIMLAALTPLVRWRYLLAETARRSRAFYRNLRTRPYREAGRCHECGYPRRGLPSVTSKCPECGTPGSV